MNREVFGRERQVLEDAGAAVREAKESGNPVVPVFSTLVDEYGKLLRQSQRLVTMGDRMQHVLNSLNHDLALSEQKYRGIFETVTEGICRYDADGTMVEVNPAMAAMFGFRDPESFLAAVPNFKMLFCQPGDYERYETLLAEDQLWRHQVKVCSPKVGFLWAEISASTMPQQGDSPGGIVSVLADVTERKHMIEEMSRLARTDSLTGLFNRGYFMELAERELTRARRNSGPLSMLIVDVDHFKNVNDSYGHDVGDKVLVLLSKILSEAVREVDVVGRFGGEEFIILLPEASCGDALFVAERILRNVESTAIDVGAGSLNATVSIGLTALEEKDDSLDILIKYADIALYAAKKNGRNRVEVYQRPGRSCRDSSIDAQCARSMG